jgi:hypothetical protein
LPKQSRVNRSSYGPESDILTILLGGRPPTIFHFGHLADPKFFSGTIKRSCSFFMLSMAGTYSVQEMTTAVPKFDRTPDYSLAYASAAAGHQSNSFVTRHKKSPPSSS